MKKKNMTVGKCFLWAVLVMMAVIQIFPLIWLVDFSLASSTEMFTSGLLIVPEKIQWGNYVKAFVDGHFLLYLKNSVLINVLAVVLVILISIMAAFACRRMHWRLSGLVKMLLLMGMMIPIHATLLGAAHSVCGVLAPAGYVSDDELYGGDPGGNRGGGGHGRVRNLPDRLSDHHAALKVVDCDGGDHDVFK